MSVLICLGLLLGLCPLGPDVLLELPRPDRLGRRDLHTDSHEPHKLPSLDVMICV